MKVKNKVIVVTGGGGGLGRALVLHLLELGAKVAAIDINEKALRETTILAGEHGKNLSTHILDITDRKKVLLFPEEVIKIHRAIDGIINNAGIIQPFIHVNELDFQKIEQVMNINFYGALYMVKAFLPHLLQRPEAHIVNVSSLGGFIPFPGQTIYGASKAALKLLTEGLYAELKNISVKVTIIHPGAMQTKIMSNSGLKTSTEEESAPKNKMMLKPEDAARQVIKAMEKNKFRAMVGKDARMLDYIYRIHPRKAVEFIVKKMGSRTLRNE
ncbi:SDR family NAD(P)-dependent oxidoreductase [Maribacter confluentis]|uniref:SDR family NAD(P)-dependent oxidoreductase n=1 Tax=Maribacter confluentis TaxID=1656093 RepID=A0ABT8RP91_9FLAO|nr:SDR family NAD(P)-dependent oxidoreductase [Maribacter confluentis]MDO1512159.1 SDR family NAD(P)-dependent oxidoreductase [Maribacter confluentis]